MVYSKISSSSFLVSFIQPHSRNTYNRFQETGGPRGKSSFCCIWTLKCSGDWRGPSARTSTRCHLYRDTVSILYQHYMIESSRRHGACTRQVARRTCGTVWARARAPRVPELLYGPRPVVLWLTNDDSDTPGGKKTNGLFALRREFPATILAFRIFASYFFWKNDSWIPKIKKNVCKKKNVRDFLYMDSISMIHHHFLAPSPLIPLKSSP